MKIRLNLYNTNIFFLILLLECHQVYSICQCAKTFSWSSTVYWQNAGCNDYELQTECKRAEWEYNDYIAGFMRYAIATGIKDSRNITFQDSINMAALSYSLEKDRPVPDCAEGLFTKNPIHGEGWSQEQMGAFDQTAPAGGKCFSSQILAQCTLAKDGVTDYISSIKTLINASNATPEFKALVIYRADNSILPTITCDATDNNKDVISGGNFVGVSTFNVLMSSSLFVSLLFFLI